MRRFLRPIRKNAEHFYGRKKMWRRKTAQKALARLRFFVARAAVRQRSAYRPVRRSIVFLYIYSNRNY
jgi:hypothetical protein